MKFSVFARRLFLVAITALAVGCFFALPAMAAPVEGPAGMAFYSPPSPLPEGSHGDLIWYRKTTSAPLDAPNSNSWLIMYHSTDALGNPNVVTGTVIVPKAPWPSLFLARPIISYAVGTHGLDQDWAPSIQLENGTDYESSNITAALEQGYAVLVTDNPGYTNGSIPTYMAGIAQGHAVLDIVRAASQAPNCSVSRNARLGIWGYSQGGQTASWAAQLQPGYAPDLNLVGVAAGGVPADFFQVAEYLDGNNGAAFLLSTVIGLWSQYPDGIPLTDLVNPAGELAVQKGLSMGVFEALFEFMNIPLSAYVIGNTPLEELVAIPSVEETLEDQALGYSHIDVPVFLYHGTADEFIALEQALQLKERYCALGVNTSFMAFPGEHIITQFQAAPYVLSWMEDRFDRKAAVATCATSNPRPVSTANPVNGDFIVSLNQWPLNGSIGLKTLGQDVDMPDDSWFTADTNMTSHEISGDLYVPSFNAPIYVILPLRIKLEITPSQPMTGVASLDNQGNLHVHGNMLVNLKIRGISGIPFSLYTATPIDFPIDFDGPIASLGNGNLKFSGTTTFPPIKGNILFNALFSSLMSGGGQTFEFSVTPPAPVMW